MRIIARFLLFLVLLAAMIFLIWLFCDPILRPFLVAASVLIAAHFAMEWESYT